MFVSNINDVKIYNLSAGKSLPDWLSERKRKAVLRKDVDLRKRIDLIQDFNMPAVSTKMRLSKDGQYLFATGSYKPRVKCFDFTQLSMKFERCFDSEPITFEVLSEDYSKLVFLHCDRYIEFHAAFGRYYRLRIPKFGRDMVYHMPSTDLCIVGQSSEIFRLNLDRGQFLEPFHTSAGSINVAETNPEHHLLCVGTQESTVEAWDPRTRERVGVLDVALNIRSNEIPSVTAIKFKNAMQMAIGTQTGQVVLYDIRATKPLLVKDHLNKLPIKRIEFNHTEKMVYSMDASMLKIWDDNNGKQRTYIEADSDFNDFCTISGTGMIFFAQENIKMLAYYIPNLGPAAGWCSFLDNLTEEIEAEAVQNIYDDYKFVSKKELDELSLEHLIGTNLLRGYMHGYFIDVRLYNKAKAASAPFAFERYKKEKIYAEIEATRASRLHNKSNVPKVNKEWAQNEKLLNDERFKIMFEDQDFKIDKNTEEFRLLAPLLSHLSKPKQQKNAIDETKQESDSNDSTDDDLFYKDKDSDSSQSSDDEARPWVVDVKKEYKKIQREKAQADVEMYEVEREDFHLRCLQKRSKNSTLGERISKIPTTNEIKRIGGSQQITFSLNIKEKPNKRQIKELAEKRKHREERRKVIRSTKTLRLKKMFRK